MMDVMRQTKPAKKKPTSPEKNGDKGKGSEGKGPATTPKTKTTNIAVDKYKDFHSYLLSFFTAGVDF